MSAVKYVFEDAAQAHYEALRKDVDVSVLASPSGTFLPLVVRPKDAQSKSLAYLRDVCRRHAAAIEAILMARGAILFRGFDIESPQQFEDAALSIHPHLNDVYHGTSPRNMVTRYTFTASELPNFFPIPQHLEMSFLENKPGRLMFWCGQDVKWGGSTALCHFGLVWQDLPDELRNKFRRLGVKYYRSYSAPGVLKLDPTQLKPWPDIFQTTDKDKVEQSCRDDKCNLEWRKDGAIRLSNAMPAFRMHPVTQQEIWSNHAQVFHPTTPYQEYVYLARHLGGIRFWLWAAVAYLLYLVQSLIKKPDEFSMNCVFGNDEEITPAEMATVRATIWKNLIDNPWQNGDLVYIDNNAVSHGRMPYGDHPGKKRKVLVAWSTGTN